MGIIFDFTTQSVKGFGYPGLGDFPVTITGTDDVKIVFEGHQQPSPITRRIIGSIDRVTGYLEATSTTTDNIEGKTAETTYELQCKPAQRMF
jgi:hypothetical protein